MKTLFSLAMIVTLATYRCIAQTGTVVFYSLQPSTGQEIADAVIPFGKAPFTGLLFDGSQRMAHPRGGTFLTFRLPVGEHQFSASYHQLDAGDPAVHLNLESDGFYCVRLSAKYKSGSPVIPLGVVHSMIEQVPCDQALKEAGKYKPLDLKRVDSSVRSNVVKSETFPKNNPDQTRSADH